MRREGGEVEEEEESEKRRGAKTYVIEVEPLLYNKVGKMYRRSKHSQQRTGMSIKLGVGGVEE